MELIKELFPQLENIPRDKFFHVVLGHRNLFSIPKAFIPVGKYVSVMDLSNNNISDVSFLSEFRNLEILVLDHNRVTSTTKFPKLFKLKTLWLNHNKIDKTVEFIIHLSKSCPKLEVLSLLGNHGAANLNNGNSLEDIEEYRYYVISEFPKLIYLDDSPVSPVERMEANRMFSKPTVFESLRIVSTELNNMLLKKPRENKVI